MYVVVTQRVESPPSWIILQGYTPLHLACDRGNLEVVQLLLKEGADKDVKDADDLTPADVARFADHNEIVQLLEN